MADYRLLTRLKDFRGKHRIEVSGADGPSVVLANGFGTDLHFWHAMLPWLEQRFRVVRFDWAVDPVHFDASRYAHMSAYAEDLKAVIYETGAAPCILIGHSLGCMAGMLAAEDEPSMFRHLVMLAPAPRYIREPGYEAGFDEAEVEDLLYSMGDNYMAWVARFAPIVVGDSANHSAIGEFSRSLLAMRPDVALSMAQCIFRMDLRDRLDAFTVPATIIQPSADPAVPVAVGRYLAERWPQARLEIIDSWGHFPHLTAPKQVIAVLEKVLGQPSTMKNADQI